MSLPKFNYSERPTITYLPIEGQALAAQMLSNIPSDIFFAASQAGWLTDLSMKIGIKRIGNAENMSFGSIPAPGDIDNQAQLKWDFEKIKKFQRVIDLLMVLGTRKATRHLKPLNSCKFSIFE